jgi:hypothetical protein
LNLQEEDPTTGLSTVAETKSGEVPTTNISKNAGKQIHRTTNTSSETKHFEITRTHPTSSALSHPEGSKAERCACSLNGVNVMADHSDVVIKAKSTGLR